MIERKVSGYFNISDNSDNSDNSVTVVSIGEDGYVNVGATGCIDIDTFIKLASTVIDAHNVITGSHRGLNEGGKLNNLFGNTRLIERLEADGVGTRNDSA